MNFSFKVVLGLGLAYGLGASAVQPAFAGCWMSKEHKTHLEIKNETFEETYNLAAFGDSWAQLRLAIRFLNGNGTPVSYVQAQEWVDLVKKNNPPYYDEGFPGWSGESGLMYREVYLEAVRIEKVIAARMIKSPAPGVNID